MTEDRLWTPVFVIWLMSLLGALGSLFFSDVMGLPPCVLCWYQRIAMYPMVAIASVGMLTKDRRVAAYLWPFVVAGLALAFYHNLLYYGLIPQEITPCAKGLSCTDRQIEWLGFISIPLLALASFVTTAGCLVWFRALVKGTVRENQ